MAKKLIIVDISSFIFRAFYAIRPLHAKDGTPVNAVHGVTSMLLKLLADYRPTHLFIARDGKGPSFRKEIFPQYKANRQETPEDLIPQFNLIKELVEKMQLPNLVLEGFEADDVIGSAATQWKDDFDEIFIASGDKDLMQFVDSNIKMLDTMKEKIYDRDGVFEKMRVWPEQIVDYLSILGDSSDNIPGMKGIGAKGAAKLLSQYQSLEGCILAREELKGKRLIDAFKNHLDDAYLSQKLIKIKTDLDLKVTASDISYNFKVTPELITFLESLNLNQQLKKIKEIDEISQRAEQNDAQEGFSFNVDNSEIKDSLTHIVVSDDDAFNELEKKLKKGDEAAFHLEFDNENFFTQKLISISISFDGINSWYLPFNHSSESLGNGKNLDIKYLDRILSSSWENKNAKLICLFAKRDFLYALNAKREFCADFFDITQAHFVIAPQDRHILSAMAGRYMDHNPIISEKDAAPLIQCSLTGAAEIAGCKATSLFQLASIFKKELAQFKT